jgi:uncharacterized protein DUF4105
MLRKTAFSFIALLAAYVVLVIVRRPSNDRDWTLDQRVLAHAEFDGPLVTVHDIRLCTYRTTSDYTCSYYDKTFDLRRLDSVWFIVEPFGRSAGVAHTFVSFGFGGEFAAVSAEIRKEKGEAFSPWLGLVRQYELMYVVADERDVVKLRSNYRHDPVYLYRARTTPERMRRMFVDMLARANKLRSDPEFYNTVTNNCTTNIAGHINTIVPGRVPFSLAMVLPGYSDRLAYRLGLIDTTLPFDQARAAARINDRAARYSDDPDFSNRIRTRGERASRPY